MPYYSRKGSPVFQSFDGGTSHFIENQTTHMAVDYAGHCVIDSRDHLMQYSCFISSIQYFTCHQVWPNIALTIGHLTKMVLTHTLQSPDVEWITQLVKVRYTLIRFTHNIAQTGLHARGTEIANRQSATQRRRSEWDCPHWTHPIDIGSIKRTFVQSGVNMYVVHAVVKGVQQDFQRVLP